MRRLTLRVWLLVTALLAHLCSGTPALAKIAPEDEARILRTSQVRAGMQGYCLTVLKGDTIERLDVKVLGVLPNQNSGRPLILVRVGGGELNRREINIASGMSGSPIYIGGKLIGAIAYAGAFAREALGLVTPIEDMLEAWDPTLPADPPGYGEIKPLPGPVTVGGSTLKSIGIKTHAGDSGAEAGPGHAWFTPLATPLIASGFSQKSVSRLGAAFGGLAVTQGPGRMNGKHIELREGSAVGFSLVTGDLDLTGIGTVTYRRGDRILAFGHPMMQMGAVGMPMSTCWVHDVFPSYMGSFKLASPVSLIGASTQDRPFSVAGTLGGTATMLPIEITVRDDRSPSSLRFRASVLKHPIVTPLAMPLVASEAIMRKRPYPGEGMARVTTTVSGKDVGPITRTNLFFSADDIGDAAATDLTEILGLFQNNKFHPVTPEKVALDVQLIQTRQTARVEKIMLNKLVFEPGETVDVAVQMRPFKADPVIRHMQITVPQNAADGRAVIAVQGGREAAGATIAPAAAEASGAERAAQPEEMKEAATIQQFFKRYQELNSNDEIVGRLLMSSASFSVEGERLSGFPPGMEYAMQSKKATATRVVRDEAKVRQGTEWFVSGTQLLGITIQKKSHSEKAKAASTTVTTSTVRTTTTSTEPEDGTETVTIEEDEDELSTGPLLNGHGAMGSVPAVDAAAKEEAGTKSGESSRTTGESSVENGSESNSESAAEEKSDEDEAKAVGRAVKTWRQATAADFLKGEMAGVAVGSALAGATAVQSDGYLQPGLDIRSLASVEDSYVWSVCPGPGNSSIAGTGSHGNVYRIPPEGAPEKLFSVSGSQALAVARDRRGRIWAGSSPDGGIWMYDGGKAAEVARAPSKHVAALAAGPDESVLAGAGDSGRIWRVTPDGKLSLLADTNQLHVQCLWTSADGSVLAGTARAAAVWRISEGRAEAILHASEEFVGSVAANARGAVYATTGPKGKLYLIEKDRAPVVLIDKLASNTAPLALDADGSVVLADASRIYRYPESGGQVVQQIKGQWEFQALTALDAGGLAAGLTNGGGVWKLSPAKEGWFESTVRDAERPADWGKMRANASGSADGVRLKTRFGDVAEPDGTWSAWTETKSGESLGLKGPRYVQYRVEFSSPSGPQPKISSLSFSYLPANRPPTVKFQKPAAGAGISGTQEVTWSGSDPDSDKLTYELSYSADSGKTWNPIGKVSAKPSAKKQSDGGSKADEGAKDGNSAASAGAEAAADAHAEELLTQTKKALDARPDIPESVRERILDSAKKAIEQRKAATVETAEPEGNGKTNGTSHKWDTTKVADGQYLLRVTASDVMANSSGALSAQAFLGPLLVTNTKPSVTLGRAAVKVDGNKEARVKGLARSKAADIAAVQFRLDGSGDWYAAEADDGMFDSRDEPFTCVLRDVKAGKHKIEVQAKDSAGNVTRAERELEVKAAAPGAKTGG